jgi:hypothetical protein
LLFVLARASDQDTFATGNLGGASPITGIQERMVLQIDGLVH